MNQYTLVHDNTDINAKSILNELRLVSKEIEASYPHFYNADGKITMSSWSPTTVDKNIKNGLSHVVRRILLDACEKSEASIPGSADITLALSVNLSLSLVSTMMSDGMMINHKSIKDANSSFLNSILERSKPVMGKTISEQIKAASTNKEIALLVLEAIRWGGMISKFEVKESLSNEPTVVVTSGFNFNLSPDENVLNNETWSKENVRIFLVDGLVENISEINNLLTRAYEEKSPIVIFARGFSNDVINTLSINRQRGTLDVLPIKTPYDEIHANTLKDISCVVGGDVISSLTGDLISMRKFEELPVIKKVTCTNKKITLTTVPSASLKSHISSLQELRESASDEKKKLYDIRLRSLINSLTTIEVPKRIKTGVELTNQMIKIMSSFLSHGLVDLNEIKTISPKHFKDSFDILIRTTGKNVIPTTHLINSIRLSTQVASELTNIGSIILLD